MRENRNNPLLVVIAVVLLAIAGILFWRQSVSGREEPRQPQPIEKSFEEQAQAIMNDPRIPPQAKEEAVAKIRQQFQNAPLQAPPQNNR